MRDQLPVRHVEPQWFWSRRCARVRHNALWYVTDSGTVPSEKQQSTAADQ